VHARKTCKEHHSERAAQRSDTNNKKRIMLPSRTSHSASIGPGVVPRGVDPHYDAEVAREYESRKNVPHNAKGSFGRPFAIDPRTSGPMTRTQCVVLF